MIPLFFETPEYEHQKEILKLLLRVIEEFNEQEHFLIEHGLNERCINGRFAMHMERCLRESVFSGYTKDIEVDRGMGGIESLKKKLYDEDGKEHDIYLDLIVHKRESDDVIGFDNLFAIEFKMKGEPTSDNHRRLQMLVKDNNLFGYRAGFEIVIDRFWEQDPKLWIEASFYNSSLRSVFGIEEKKETIHRIFGD